ncbi:MAG: molybdopterin molybdotransferase [Candidatus Promineifilaceae bacterium]|jgi:molybdopterin molybdotransferase
MISVAEAEAIIRDHVPLLGDEPVTLADAAGRVLRESITADRPFPPFDRVAMDGIAINSQDYEKGTRRFPVAFVQAAGSPAQALTAPSHCVEVMTGAVLPGGTDCVIPVENIKLTNDVAELTDQEAPTPFDNVHRKGSDRDVGTELLSAGTRLRGPQIAVAATVGATTVRVSTQPRVAIISTGSELVPVSTTPAPHQIRQSNVHAIETALHLAGHTCTTRHHIADDAAAIRKFLAECLSASDIIILSGGVSAGRYDFVPDVVTELGISIHFHHVRQRPGKPLLFGTNAGQKSVFGLPGNPVSALVCLHRYILPAIAAAQGCPIPPANERTTAILDVDLTFKKPLTCFKPVRLIAGVNGCHAVPVPMNGSGDLAGLAQSDGMLELPEKQTTFTKGSPYPIWRW